MQKVTRMKRQRDKEVAGFYQRSKSGYYTKKYYVNGKPEYFATGTSDLSEAIKRFNNFKGSPFIKTNNDFIKTVDKFIKYKTDNGTYTEASVRWSKLSLKKFGDYTNNIAPKEVTAELIESFKKHLSDRIKPASVKIYLRGIKSFFSWCEKVEKIIHENPLKGIKLGNTHSSGKIIYCTPEQRDLLYNNSPNDDMSFILFCGFDAGLRKDEIINAKRDWFFLDESSPFLKVRQAITKPRLRDGEKPFRIKNKKERTVPLTKKFATFLKSYLKDLKPLDFALKPEVTFGSCLYRYDFRRPFEIYMREQGLEWVTTHVMRHTFASILASRGVSIFEIAQYLGDRYDVTERHYAHLIPGRSNINKLHS